MRLHLCKLSSEIVHVGFFCWALLSLGLKPRLHTGLSLLLAEFGSGLLTISGSSSGFFPARGLPISRSWFAIFCPLMGQLYELFVGVRVIRVPVPFGDLDVLFHRHAKHD